jgi:hypothetical protein
MSPQSQQALKTLRSIARHHPGASSGERAAAEILRNLVGKTRLDFADCYGRMDGRGKRAVILLLGDLASGRTGLAELHWDGKGSGRN